MKRLLVRLVGVAGVVSGVALPVAYTSEQATAGEALVGNVDASGYLLTDVGWVAAVTVLACLVLLGTATRHPGTDSQELAQAWATLLAGGVTLVAPVALLASVGYDPAASASLPGPGLLPTLVGGAIAFGSAFRGFYGTVEPRLRDVSAVTGFLLALASMPFPLYEAAGRGWSADEDVNTYTVDPGSGGEVPQGPPSYTGTDLDLLAPVAAVFAVFLLVLVVRYVRDKERFGVAGREVTTDLVLGGLVFVCFGIIATGTRNTTPAGVTWRFHGMLLQWSMALALLSYVGPNVLAFVSRGTSGSEDPDSSDTGPDVHPLAARIRSSLPPVTPAVADVGTSLAHLDDVGVSAFVTDAGGVVALRATGDSGGCLLGYEPDQGRWVVVAATETTSAADREHLDDAAWSWLDSAYPGYRIRREDSVLAGDAETEIGKTTGDVDAG